MQREQDSTRFPLGSPLPDFKLKNVDGTLVGSTDLQGARGALVVFTCNHCPYVKGSEALLAAIVRRFAPEGLQAVTINSNDPVSYPEDSFAKMQEKAAAQDLPFPYLLDETQEVARMFDAACTPEAYLFDRSGRLVFHGAITDRPKEPGSARTDFLSPAIEAVLSARTPTPGFVHPLGCSIKWKQA